MLPSWSLLCSTFTALSLIMPAILGQCHHLRLGTTPEAGYHRLLSQRPALLAIAFAQILVLSNYNSRSTQSAALALAAGALGGALGGVLGDAHDGLDLCNRGKLLGLCNGVPD
jgi:hypothetical protein